MTKNFILEIGTEEMPASYIKPALDQLLALFVEAMKQRQLSQSHVEHLLCEAGRQRMLSWVHLGLVEE